MKKEVVAYKSSKAPISEQFRTLRTNIQFMNVDKKMKVLLITSIFPNEGKSWVSSNLAVTFAQAGKKVILVDSDMRKGRQYAIFGVSPKPGLSNFLSQTEIDENGKMSEDVSNYIKPTEVENLSIITAGDIPPNPSELLVSAQMIMLLDELRKKADIVIIDGTPSEIVTDSIILSRLADSTVIVTAHKITKKDALDRVIKNIKNVGGNIAGVILNKVPVSAKKYDSRYYYYGKEVSEKKDKKFNKKAKKKAEIKASSIIEKLNNLTNNTEKEISKDQNEIQDSAKSDVTENIQNVNEYQADSVLQNENTNQTIGNEATTQYTDYSAKSVESINIENVNTENINTENINIENVNTENINTENTNIENVSTENINTQNINAENINTENINTEKETNVMTNTDNQDDAKIALEQTNLILQQINNYLNKEKNEQ